jgi:hypothetical protein
MADDEPTSDDPTNEAVARMLPHASPAIDVHQEPSSLA